MKHSTGKIIVMAFPDTFVKMSDEWICKFLPFFGLGTKDYIKAGHAAFVLIDNNSREAFYYDFGRYITPRGYGRVRNAETDAELEIPFKAIIDAHGQLQNLDEFLLWLEAHPHKTHGEGRLLASLCEAVDFERAKSFADQLQSKGSILYGAFERNGSNCSRFVTDTLLACTNDKKIRKALQFNKRFTPSTVGNVEKATFGSVFEVFEGVVSSYKGSALKENLKNYFDRTKKNSEKVIVNKHKLGRDVKKLEGIGSSAYFEIVSHTLPAQYFRIKRYNDKGIEDYDGVYFSEIFDENLPFEFTYDSHCAYCHVLQNGTLIKLLRTTSFNEFNSLQKERSA